MRESEGGQRQVGAVEGGARSDWRSRGDRLCQPQKREQQELQIERDGRGRGMVTAHCPSRRGMGAE